MTNKIEGNKQKKTGTARITDQDIEDIPPSNVMAIMSGNIKELLIIADTLLDVINSRMSLASFNKLKSYREGKVNNTLGV